MTSRRIAAGLLTLGMAAAAGGTAAVFAAGAPATHPATGQHAAMTHNGQPGMTHNAQLAMTHNGQPGMTHNAQLAMTHNGPPTVTLDSAPGMTHNAQPGMTHN